RVRSPESASRSVRRSSPDSGAPRGPAPEIFRERGRAPCSRARREVCCAAVGHEEAYPLLASYAAGTLDGAVSSTVRAHLAGGCVECLREVFGRPVGLPRNGVPAALESPLPASRTPAKTRRAGLVAAVVVLGLAAGSGVAWTIAGVRRGAAAARAEMLALS